MKPGDMVRLSIDELGGPFALPLFNTPEGYYSCDDEKIVGHMSPAETAIVLATIDLGHPGNPIFNHRVLALTTSRVLGWNYALWFEGIDGQ